MAKTVNYSPEMTKEMVTMYTAAETDETRAEVVNTLAEQFGKSVASIRSKLTREKVYISAVYKTKNGGSVVSKNSMVDTIANLCGVTPENFNSLEKANKKVLTSLIDNLKSEA